MDKKRATIRAKEYKRKLKEATKDFPMSKEGSPTVTDTETGEVTYGRPKKYSLGGGLGGGLGIKNFIVEKFKNSNNTNQNYSLPEDNYFNDLIRVKPIKASTGKSIKDLIGPSEPKGSVSPKIRAYDDEFKSAYGAGVNVTTKKGVSFDFDVDKKNYKGTDYKEPESYKASVGKKGDKLSYGATATKQGDSKSVEAGFTFKYKNGGMKQRKQFKMIKGNKGTMTNLKSVPAEKEKSLGKLSTKIRNKMGYAAHGMEVRGYGAARTKGMGLQDESIPMKNNDYIKDLID